MDYNLLVSRSRTKTAKNKAYAVRSAFFSPATTRSLTHITNISKGQRPRKLLLLVMDHSYFAGRVLRVPINFSALLQTFKTEFVKLKKAFYTRTPFPIYSTYKSLKGVVIRVLSNNYSFTINFVSEKWEKRTMLKTVMPKPQ